MKYILTILLLAFAVTSYAQPPQPAIQWVKTMGNTDVDAVQSIVATDDGGFIAACAVDFPSTGDFTKPVGHNFYDICVIRFDSAHNVVWQRCYGGSDSEWPTKIIALKNNKYLIGGYTGSSDGDITHKRWGGDNAWLLCIDGQGVPLWDSTYGSIASVGLGDVISTLDGGFMLSINGNHGSGDLDSVYGGNGGFYDAHLLKLDSNGTKEWVQNIGGTGDESLMKVIQHPDSNYYITLYNESLDIDCTPSGFSLNGFPNPADNPSRDMYVAKLTKDGQMLWHYDYGGTFFDDIYPGGGLLLADDTSLFVVGNTRSNDYMASSNHSGSWTNPIKDILVLKIDTSGKLLWSTCIGGSYDEQCYDITSNGEGGILIVGTSQSWDGDVPRNIDSSGLNPDCYIANLDENGNTIWGAVLRGGGGTEQFRTVCILDGTRRVIAAGGSGSLDGDIPQPIQGSTDLLFAEFSLWPVSTSVVIKEEQLLIYPNPARDQFTIQASSEGAFAIQRMNGQQLLQGRLLRGRNKVDASHLSAGVYLAAVQLNDITHYKKLIIHP